MFKDTIFIGLLILLAGCSDTTDPYQKYLGAWERQDVSKPEVIIISQDGESILLTEKFSKRNKKIKQKVLNKSDGKLSTNVGFVESQFSLSEDKNTLRVANLSFARINETRINEIQQDIDNKELEITKKKKIDEANAGLCDTLNKKYQNEKSKIWSSNTLKWEEKVSGEKELKKVYSSRGGNIPNCYVQVGF